ncbi:hypothetical protein Bca4012_055865 [Brassica carinata]
MIGWCDARSSISTVTVLTGPILSLHVRSSMKKANDATDVYGQDLPKAVTAPTVFAGTCAVSRKCIVNLKL